MLASVTGVDEAHIVLDAGVDIIDLKDPSQGALGALPLNIIEAIVQDVDGRRLVSATIGDLPMQPDLVMRRAEAVAATGVDIVKIGFFGSKCHLDCIRAVMPLASRGQHMVAVLFADEAPDLYLLPELASAGFHGVMLDTAHKNGKRLLDYLSLIELQGFVRLAKSLGLLTGLAGSLCESDISRLVPVAPDYLGFRGALCERSNRAGAMDIFRVEHLLGVLYKCNKTQYKEDCFPA
jgi:uncharacterized protein (UPF0264 family)